MFLGDLIAKLSIDTTSLEAAAAKMQAFGNKVSRNMGTIGKTMQSAGRSMTMYLTLPIVGVGAGILKMAGDFERSMNKVKALTQASGTDFERLRNQAKELGATTRFSASQAADAMGYLAMAGLDVNEIMGAMPGTLQIAAASGQDLAQVADQTTNILTGYGLEVKELARVNDVLTKTFISSNTTLSELSEAMVYAAPTASAMGVSFEDAATMMGLMANAGIKASMAGTTLRGALARLAAPTDKMKEILGRLKVEIKTSDGSLRNMKDILGDLGEAGATAGELIELFGLRAGPGMTALTSQGKKAMVDFVNELNNAGGVTQKVSEQMDKGLNYSLIELKSAVEGLAISIGESGILEDAIEFTKRLTELTRAANEAHPSTMRLVVDIGLFLAALGPILWIGGKIVGVIASIGTAFTGAGAAAAGAGTAATASAAPFVAAAVLIGGAIWGLYSVFTESYDAIKNATWDFGEMWNNFVEVFVQVLPESWIESLGQVKDSFVETMSGVKQQLVDDLNWMAKVISEWTPNLYVELTVDVSGLDKISSERAASKMWSDVQEGAEPTAAQKKALGLGTRYGEDPLAGWVPELGKKGKKGRKGGAPGGGGGGGGGADDLKQTLETLKSLTEGYIREIMSLTGSGMEQLTKWHQDEIKALDEIAKKGVDVTAAKAKEEELFIAKKQNLEQDYNKWLAGATNDQLQSIEIQRKELLRQYKGIKGAEVEIAKWAERQKLLYFIDLEAKRLGFAKQFADEMAGMTPFLSDQVRFQRQSVELQHETNRLALERQLLEKTITPALYEQAMAYENMADAMRRFNVERQAWQTEGVAGALKEFSVARMKEAATRMYETTLEVMDQLEQTIATGLATAVVSALKGEEVNIQEVLEEIFYTSVTLAVQKAIEGVVARGFDALAAALGGIFGTTDPVVESAKQASAIQLQTAKASALLRYKTAEETNLLDQQATQQSSLVLQNAGVQVANYMVAGATQAASILMQAAAAAGMAPAGGFEMPGGFGMPGGGGFGELGAMGGGVMGGTVAPGTSGLPGGEGEEEGPGAKMAISFKDKLMGLIEGDELDFASLGLDVGMSFIDQALEGLPSITELLSGTFGKGAADVAAGATEGASAISNAGTNAGNFLTNVGKGFFNFLKNAGGFLTSVGKGMGGALISAGKALGGILKSILSAIPGIGGLFSFLPFHEGGLVEAHGGLDLGKAVAAHNGMRADERLIKVQLGEGIINRDAMKKLQEQYGGDIFEKWLNKGKLPPMDNAPEDLLAIESLMEAHRGLEVGGGRRSVMDAVDDWAVRPRAARPLETRYGPEAFDILNKGGPDPQNRQKDTTININIQGHLVDHDRFAREVIPAIRKAAADGVRG